MLKPYGPISVTFWLTAEWQHAAAADFLSNGADLFQICEDLDMVNVPSRSKLATRTEINDHFHKVHSLSLNILTFKGEILAVLSVKVCRFWWPNSAGADWLSAPIHENVYYQLYYGTSFDSRLYCNSLSNMSKKFTLSIKSGLYTLTLLVFLTPGVVPVCECEQFQSAKNYCT